MIFKNSTVWPNYFLRRMLSFCCKELGMPVRAIRDVAFRNSRSSWGGSASYWRGRITVCVGRAEHFPARGYRHGNGHQNTIADRTECLVWVTAHEAAHCLQNGTKTRAQGGGGSEIATEWHAKPVLEKFRAMRDALLAEWNEAPALAIKGPALTLTERRRAKAIADLAKWERKLKLAKTKVKKLKTRVNYYNKK